MYAGKIVEVGEAVEVFERPGHPYAAGLLRSTPRIDDRLDRLVAIDGAPPNLMRPPEGCAFHPRCPLAEPHCHEEPPLAPREGGRLVSCWHAFTPPWAEQPGPVRREGARARG
jgi:oligopeptide/dipeptide ABC transporter ATP-binding protein